MKRFKYDVVKLIEGVRDRPCLWNKYIENYKDRVERRQAWIEIFHILDERYDEMSPVDKRITSEMVLTKWTNMRDTFVKSLKSKGGKTKKQYVLHDHLKFLLQIMPETGHQEQDSFGYNEDQQSFMKDEVDDGSYNFTKNKNFEMSYDESDASVPELHLQSERRSKRKRHINTQDPPTTEAEAIDFVTVDDPRIMNEDEAFFASLLPTVVKYNEDERLEFRIEVLALMRRIKDKRKWTPDAVE